MSRICMSACNIGRKKTIHCAIHIFDFDGKDIKLTFSDVKLCQLPSFSDLAMCWSGQAQSVTKWDKIIYTKGTTDINCKWVCHPINY